MNNLQTIINHLQIVVDSFPIQKIFAAQRQRELPIRDFLVDSLEAQGIVCRKEAPYARIDKIGKLRKIDFVSNNLYFQLGHFTLAQYNKRNFPICSKVAVEQSVFDSIHTNIPSDAEKFLIYITSDITGNYEFNAEISTQFPLLKYFRDARYNEKIKENKLNLRNQDLEAIHAKAGIELIKTFESKNFLRVNERINASLTLDLIRI